MTHKTFNLHLQTFEFMSLKKDSEALAKSNQRMCNRTYYTEHQRQFYIVKDRTTIRKATPQLHSKCLQMWKGLNETKYSFTSSKKRKKLLMSFNQYEDDQSGLMVKLNAKHVKASTEQFDSQELEYKNHKKTPHFSNDLLRSLYG